MPYKPEVRQLAREVRRQKAAEDLEFFANYYIPSQFDLPDPPFASDIDRTYLENKNSLTLIPIGHGKTTRITFLHSVHKICMDPNVRILACSKKAGLATKFVHRVAKELKNNEKLIRDFGPFYNKNDWSKGQFTVQNRTENKQEPTMMGAGVGTTIEGYRYDYIVCDDILDVEHQTSEKYRETTLNWFKSVPMGRCEPQGLIEVIGTPWHPEDPYAHIEKMPGFYVRRLDAIQDEKNQEVLWPERWDWKELMSRKENMGSVAFNQKYRCDPQAITGRWFQGEWVQWCEREEVPKLKRVCQAWDLNISEDDRADFTVGITMGVDEEGDFWILDMFRDHMMTGHEDAIINFYKKWNASSVDGTVGVHRVGVETNVFQHKVYENVKAREPTMPLNPIKNVKRTKSERILSMQPAFENGRVHVVNSIPDKDEIVNELISFPDGSHDDILDATEFTYRMLGSSGMTLLENEELDQVI